MPAPEPAPEPRIPFRRRMRAVAWAKVILPLAALALLSTVFLLARPQGGGMDALPFTRAAEVAGDPGIDGPRLAGVAEDGTRLTLVAARVGLPSAGGALTLAAPRLSAEAPDGGTLAVEAPEGAIENGEALTLSGGVILRLDGLMGRYDATAPNLLADLATARLDLGGPVVAEGPFGHLEAGGLTVTRGSRGDEEARVVFKGGVRLLYQP